METLSNEQDLVMLELEVTLGAPISEIVQDEEFATGLIDAGEQSEEELQELVEAVKRNIVTVSDTAPCGCIDGRMCLHTMAGGETSARPSVAGGPVTAYAASELAGWHGSIGGDSESRFKLVNDRLNAAGMPTGSHIDYAAELCKLDGGKTGCGADDRAPQNVDNVFAKPEAVSALTAALLGEQFNADSMNFTDRQELAEQLADWNPVAVVKTIVDRDPSAVEVLESDDSETHGHSEVLVVFNYVQSSTVDRDALVKQTGKQVFVVDVWYIDKMARALSEGPGAEEQYSSLKHAMIAYQLGTYMSLCKGNQRPLFITPAA